MIQPHHEQGRVDVADDDQARGFVAPVMRAPRELRLWWHTGVRPVLAQGIALGQHPVAHGECVTVKLQAGDEGGQRAGTALLFTVMQREAVALHFSHTHQVRLGGGVGHSGQLLNDGQRQANAAQTLESL